MASPPDNTEFRFSLRYLFGVTTAIAIVAALCAGDSDLAMTLRLLIVSSSVISIVFLTPAAFCSWLAQVDNKYLRFPLFVCSFCGVMSLLVGTVYYLGQETFYYGVSSSTIWVFVLAGLSLCGLAVYVRSRYARRS